ncbi:MAG TPA: hypothetical protein VD997_06975 [Phycisphaerales bacterium]|nr:hypothetical protein [Phycisphaerales bacterium]
MRQLRGAGAVVLCVLLAGCASDPELARYQGGGRASPRGVRAAKKELATIGGVVGGAAVIAGAAVAECELEKALEQGTDAGDRRKERKR